MEAKKALILTLLLAAAHASALEVDERLTMRLLKTSDTRKTLLVNRGSEDGLAEGDHAKFFVSAGVVARAVCLKVSPSRSVWAAYRLVNADLIVPDAVMNLKITPPVKITQDETKSVVKEDVPTQVTAEDPAALGIPLAEGASDLPAGTTPAEAASRADLEALREPTGDLRQKNLEVWAAMHVSSLSSKTSGETQGQDYSGSNVQTNFALAGEYYSKEERAWWARFSPYAFLNVQRGGTTAYQGSKQEEAATEFGGGLNWQPWTAPWTANEFIPFFTAAVGIGTVQSTYEPGEENPNGVSQQARGSSFSTAFGGGFKFYTLRGFGARAVLDYYMRNEKLKDSDLDASWTRSVAGPRLWVGLGYRF